MAMLWLAFALTCMLTDWAALWKGRPSINYASKPLTLLFLLIWFLAAAAPGLVRSAFALGLFFSLAGDGFLLLPPRYFIFGLAAFLLAHLSYVAGFAVGFSMPSALFWAFAGVVGQSYSRWCGSWCARRAATQVTEKWCPQLWSMGVRSARCC